jgi:hypothetical protein
MKQIILLSMTVISILLLQTVASQNAFATEPSDTVKPTITTQGDIFKISALPTPVSLSILAYDDVDGQIRVDCDKTSETIFKIGKTTVRCYTIDSAGNEARASFEVTVGDNFVKIPDWVKNLTQYWVNQQMSDEQYAASLKYLIVQKIVHVPYSKQTTDDASSEVPIWIKTNSQKWIDGKTSNDEFSIGIQWMLERGLIQF